MTCVCGGIWQQREVGVEGGWRVVLIDGCAEAVPRLCNDRSGRLDLPKLYDLGIVDNTLLTVCTVSTVSTPGRGSVGITEIRLQKWTSWQNTMAWRTSNRKRVGNSQGSRSLIGWKNMKLWKYGYMDTKPKLPVVKPCGDRSLREPWIEFTGERQIPPVPEEAVDYHFHVCLPVDWWNIFTTETWSEAREVNITEHARAFPLRYWLYLKTAAILRFRILTVRSTAREETYFSKESIVWSYISIITTTKPRKCQKYRNRVRMWVTHFANTTTRWYS